VEQQRLLHVEEAVQVDVLLGEADQPARLQRVVRMTEYPRVARARAHKVADGRDQRRLARAVGPEQAEELAVGHDQVDVVEREQPVLVALGEAGQLECRNPGHAEPR
jgi:hypothetical protein